MSICLFRVIDKRKELAVLKGKFSLLLTVIVVLSVLLSASEGEGGYVEEWVPYVPLSRMVDLKFWMSDRTSYINVSITFPDAGFTVSDWGTVIMEGYEIWVDSKIWDWTGPSALVITMLSHTYDLGRLEEGNYTFTFMAWGARVKSISFVVTIAGDVDGDGKVDILDVKSVKLAYSGIIVEPMADIDGDGEINSLDVKKVKLIYSGLIV